ncbi:hypothetical protein QUC31_019576 [Theobroma cacao]|uniref:Uncharacterized protein n=1 Tax=Theobroma cacao TaxID=3641 RepID=A0A061GR86_THECC|nr:Uncharacterized protein TCM_039440 [Theobroma cacao]
MARMLSKSAALRGAILHHHRASFLCHFSSKAKLIEIDLDSSSSTASAINKMEEMFHAIMVHKSTPNWLPFLPDSSFWVPLPPKGSKRVADVIEQLSNQLTREESLSLTTGRGWPCLSFFIRDGEYADVARMDVKVEFPQQAEGEVKVEVLIDSGDKSS